MAHKADPAPTAPHDRAEMLLNELEALLREMKFPDIRRGEVSAYDPMRQLFEACRSTVHQHRRCVEAGLLIASR